MNIRNTWAMVKLSSAEGERAILLHCTPTPRSSYLENTLEPIPTQLFTNKQIPYLADLK